MVEDVGQRLDSAGGRVLLPDDGGELAAHDLLDLLDHRRAGLAHARDPQRDVRAACARAGGRAPGAARPVWRLATHERDRLRRLGRRKAAICSGGVRRRNSNGRVSMTVESRPSSSSARSPPSARSSTSRANSMPPATSPSPSGPAAAASSARIDSVVLLLDRAQLAPSPARALDLVLAQVLHHLGGEVGAERGHQHGGLAPAGESGRRGALGRARRPRPRRARSGQLRGHALVLLHPAAQLLATRSGLLSRELPRPGGGTGVSAVGCRLPAPASLGRRGVCAFELGQRAPAARARAARPAGGRSAPVRAGAGSGW